MSGSSKPNKGFGQPIIFSDSLFDILEAWLTAAKDQSQMLKDGRLPLPGCEVSSEFDMLNSGAPGGKHFDKGLIRQSGEHNSQQDMCSAKRPITSVRRHPKFITVAALPGGQDVEPTRELRGD